MIRQFRLAGAFSSGVTWTPHGGGVVLTDLSTSRFYRGEVR